MMCAGMPFANLLMFVVHFLRRHFVYQCAAVHDGSMVDVVL